MDAITLISEEKIKEAIERGEFRNLLGQGKPLKVDDLSHIPEELRAGYIILKNAGVLPEEVELKKEIISLQSLINCCYEDNDKKSLKTKINEKILRFNMLMERRRIKTSVLNYYRDKINERLGF